jgi:hypothetical protein
MTTADRDARRERAARYLQQWALGDGLDRLLDLVTDFAGGESQAARDEEREACAKACEAEAAQHWHNMDGDLSMYTSYNERGNGADFAPTPFVPAAPNRRREGDMAKDKFSELHESARLVVNGSAKISEVDYGDDGIDMAKDIMALFAERDALKQRVDDQAVAMTTALEILGDDSQLSTQIMDARAVLATALQGVK